MYVCSGVVSYIAFMPTMRKSQKIYRILTFLEPIRELKSENNHVI